MNNENGVHHECGLLSNVPSTEKRELHGLLLLRSLLRLSLVGLVLGSILASAQGPKPALPKPETTPQSLPAPPATTSHEITSQDVSAFLDGIMPQQLAREDISGAVVSIVKDGKVLFAKGYGYADVEVKKPVSADDTLFRPGSISK